MKFIRHCQFFLVTFTGLFFLSVTPNTYAATNSTFVTDQISAKASNINDEGWHFLIAPYGWMSAIDGDVSVKGSTLHAFIPFSKILDNLDFVGEAHLEANRGPWTFMIDPTYLKVTATFNQTIAKTKVFPDSHDLTAVIMANETLVSATTLVDGGVFYRLLSGAPACNQYASFELLGGARYLGFNNSLEFRRSRNISLDQFTFDHLRNLNVSGTTQLLAPIVGARIKYEPTSKIHLWLRGDGGGFDVDDMQSTWSATAGATYTVHPHVDLSLAYRVLDVKFTKQDAGLNMLMYGPMAGIVFYW